MFGLLFVVFEAKRTPEIKKLFTFAVWIYIFWVSFSRQRIFVTLTFGGRFDQSSVPQVTTYTFFGNIP